MLRGKRLSILGDSISTYQGASNNASANSTTINNPYYYRAPFPIEKTYWRQVMSSFVLSLCVNNSWSGGNLSGRDDKSSGVNRARELSCDDGTSPDIIIVFMGINDLGRNVSADTFAADYERTLTVIKERHPKAKVCCVNLPNRDIFTKRKTEEFNERIADAVLALGNNFFIADLFHSRLCGDFYYMNTTDGLHPDEDGMKIIAEVVGMAIRKNCC